MREIRPSSLEGGVRLIPHPYPYRSAYFTANGRLWLWLLNSGAYMHWIWATPV